MQTCWPCLSNQPTKFISGSQSIFKSRSSNNPIIPLSFLWSDLQLATYSTPPIIRWLDIGIDQAYLELHLDIHGIDQQVITTTPYLNVTSYCIIEESRRVQNIPNQRVPLCSSCLMLPPPPSSHGRLIGVDMYDCTISRQIACDCGDERGCFCSVLVAISVIVFLIKIGLLLNHQSLSINNQAWGSLSASPECGSTGCQWFAQWLEWMRFLPQWNQGTPHDQEHHPKTWHLRSYVLHVTNRVTATRHILAFKYLYKRLLPSSSRV